MTDAEVIDSDLRICIDEIAKTLFASSQTAVLDFINHVFGNYLKHDGISIKSVQTEYIENFNKLQTDVVLCAVDKQGKEFKIHIEVQTCNDSRIDLRMFRYGYLIAHTDTDIPSFRNNFSSITKHNNILNT